MGVQKQLEQPAVSHSGAIDGFQSFLLYFSDQDIAIAVVTNAFPAPAAGNPELVAMAVAKAALDALSDPSPVVFPGIFLASAKR